MTYHSNISLEFVEQHPKTFEMNDPFKLAWWNDFKRRGYDYWPVCGNVDNRGTCRGHEELCKQSNR